MDFYTKYIKYKNKYLKLKGGGKVELKLNFDINKTLILYDTAKGATATDIQTFINSSIYDG